MPSGEVRVHQAINLSFFFDFHSKYAFLSFVPSIFIDSENELARETKQSLGKEALEKLYNNKYDELLEKWNEILFTKNKFVFDYPLNSGTGFEFSISKNTSFASVMVLDNNYRTYHPNQFDKRLLQHSGIQFKEPQLIFTNGNNNLAQSKDFHPMRALTNHKPFDFPLNGSVYSNELKLGVICGKIYSKKLHDFLCGLNKKQIANVNQDYLIDYPGFAQAYNISINIPSFDDSDFWEDIEIDHSSGSQIELSRKLARLINDKIEKIASNQGQATLVVFIPNEWIPYCSYEHQGESFDLHDYIKAFAASKGISTQLIQEDTLTDNLKCQIYWWLSLSFYVKSLRTPWVLNNSERETAYAGIGYSLKNKGDKSEVVIGCSHIYNSDGQGLKYKLSKVDNYTLDKQANPFLSYDDAFQFGVTIRELFYHSMSELPKRVVVHKRTKFTPEEVNGITESLKLAGIENIDLIEINYESSARYLATRVFNGELNIDGFPISRGTCVVTNKTTALIWTHGIVPSVKNPSYKYYLGGRSIPAPLKIIKHYGMSNINTIALEILGLTKMNWNSFDLYTKLPATIDSSNEIAKIGKLLARFEGRTYDYRYFI